MRPLTLRDLEASFLRRDDERSHTRVESLAEADGVMFLCPKCYDKVGGNVGVHSVICWFEGHVPDDVSPKPGRWTPRGTGLDDLTFVPSKARPAVSVYLPGKGCGAHFHVKNGRIE